MSNHETHEKTRKQKETREHAEHTEVGKPTAEDFSTVKCGDVS